MGDTFTRSLCRNKDKTKYDEKKDDNRDAKKETPAMFWTEEAVKAAIESAKNNADLVSAWNNASPETQQSLKVLFSEKKKTL